ncbi:uncharacterized protein LOC110250723 [Exaiptasia diaphana]|uniref:THAP-type domain-containing protein n=1 Tax=Exaiptasia diaphana TaxID=2652724 RepID=A0A913Y0V8_EXADI|nr:uncharacterized protein LOC110250723 [Exaiptasia diaphana]
MGFGHRNCVVVGCNNSGKSLHKWASQQCEIHSCLRGTSPCDCPPPFKLFPFPTELKHNEARKRWTKLIKREESNGKVWLPKKASRVCSEHFVDEKPTENNPDPILKLGYDFQVPKKRKLPTERPLLSVKRPKHSSQESSASESIPTTVEPDDSPEVTLTSCSEEIPVNYECSNYSSSTITTSNLAEEQNTERPWHIIHDHAYSYGWYEMENSDFCTDEVCLKVRRDQHAEINNLRERVAALEDEIEFYKIKVNALKNKGLRHSDLKDDKTVRNLTGIPTKESFHKMFNLTKRNIKKVHFWSGPSKSTKKGRTFKRSPKKFGPQRVLPQKDEFLLTLMKLRLGSTNVDLAQRFGVSDTTVSNIFTTWIKILGKKLRCLVYNPSIEVVKATLPDKFKKPGFSNVRHIIDCTEIFIETPSDPFTRAATWSDYKHHNTVKILVSITPNGAFNFVSKAWGGRTSDVHVTKECSFYDTLEPYDEVMADRGFTITEDLLLRNARLHIPPGKRGQEQFTKAEVKKTKAIANLRIFVEQAIRRMKTFRLIKNELPISLLSNIDDIIIVCAALCNLYKPLAK